MSFQPNAGILHNKSFPGSLFLPGPKEPPEDFCAIYTRAPGICRLIQRLAYFPIIFTMQIPINIEICRRMWYTIRCICVSAIRFFH